MRPRVKPGYVHQFLLVLVDLSAHRALLIERVAARWKLSSPDSPVVRWSLRDIVFAMRQIEVGCARFGDLRVGRDTPQPLARLGDVTVYAEILIKDAFAQLQLAVLAIRANGFQGHSGHWHVLSLIEGGLSLSELGRSTGTASAPRPTEQGRNLEARCDSASGHTRAHPDGP